MVVSDPPGLIIFTCFNMLVNFHIYWSSWNLALLLINLTFLQSVNYFLTGMMAVAVVDVITKDF